MFVLNPDRYLLPDYKISPFQTGDISFNNTLPEDDSIDDYFRTRFGHDHFYYTYNGRHALNQVLTTFHLKKEDAVTILTTSQNLYISSCVTGEIEKFCRWNRAVDESTRLIVVIHEFGYPYPEIEQLKKFNLPIIEDCAYSFFSKSSSYTPGAVGDFAIYSFPKMFPVQIGGMMVSNREHVQPEELPVGFKEYLRKVLSYYVQRRGSLIERRIGNYHFLEKELIKMGFSERFRLEEGIVPGVFMFDTSGKKLNLPELKEHLTHHGIQCSVFYGEDSFFIPVHQSLHDPDMHYFVEVIGSFIQ